MKKWKYTREELLRNPDVVAEYARLLPVKIAARIISARTSMNLTQKDLAELAGTSQSAISRLESGHYDWYTLKTLRKIAKALGQTVEVIFKSEAA